MKMNKALPVELMDKIVMMSGDLLAASVLRKHITKYAYNNVVSNKNTLIYGPVQSGKTKEIISFIKAHKGDVNVLVIQNSLSMLKQYEKRLESEGVKYQTITGSSKVIEKGSTILVMANLIRYSYFNDTIACDYNLIVDEADQLLKNCKLKGIRNVHVTATPFSLSYQYDIIIKVKINPCYKGIKDLHISTTSLESSISNFLNRESGMMLINRYWLSVDMFNHALSVSTENPGIPIVLLNSERRIFLNGRDKTLSHNKSVSEIIDSLACHSHIIFVSNRVGNRGVSFVSSDYTRHLTDQYLCSFTSITSFLQKLRILGIYKDTERLNLIVPRDKLTKVIEYSNTRYL